MRVIVCGAGPVGAGIARQLASEENDVIIIDSSADNLARVRDTLDVSVRQGVPSHPTTLQNAGAADAEMIIAVTTSDEINMIICQVAHSLFNVQKKIARIRHKNYLMPMWSDLYRKDHLPLDYIISPEKEVAEAILNRLHVPGALDSIPFADERVQVIEVRCTEQSPAIGQHIGNIEEMAADYNMSIIGINRNRNLIIPSYMDQIEPGDELFFIVDKEHVQHVMALFGHDEKEARRVLIIGGGNIGFAIAEALENESQPLNVKLIEIDRMRAEYTASRLKRTTVINGNSLDRDILKEAGIASTEMVIAVTNDDEVNILASILAKGNGARHVLTLINKGQSYGPLVSDLGIDVAIDPREVTVSSILQHARKGKVRAAHAICDGTAEIIEAEAVIHSSIIGRTVHDLDLPKGVKIGAIVRGEYVIIPDEMTLIAEQDRIILISKTSQIHKVDQIFSSRVDYF